VSSPPKGTDFAQYNFDHPDAIDFDACYEVLKQLVLRQEAEMPQYSFKEHRRLEETVKAVPTDLILIEGILAFHDPVTP
jgi:Uridine kinase